MRDLLEVVVTCPDCGGRVPVHLEGRPAPHLVGACERCGVEALCSLGGAAGPVGAAR